MNWVRIFLAPTLVALACALALVVAFEVLCEMGREPYWPSVGA